jgi:hypothetical protein
VKAMTRKQIPISQLKRGPIRHEQLSLSLTARINYLQEALDEVYPQTIEQWLDEFQRDANPESEVVWWERLTRCYLASTEPKTLSLRQNQSAFKVLFTLGMGNDLHGMGAEIANLPEGSQEEILELMGRRVQ